MGKPSTIDPSLASYVVGWRERVASRERARVEREGVLLAQVTELTRRLRAELGAGRVVLFGSLARGDTGPASDVDLLVEGLDPARLTEAWALARRVVRAAWVDIVPDALAREEVRARAHAEGRVLDA